MAATSAGPDNVGLSTPKSLAIPVPSLTEPRRIVAEVERRLSLIDDLAAALAANR